MNRVVVVGAGQAGFQAAASLRQAKFEGTITLLSDESELPYQRPLLSKEYLLGSWDARRLLYRQEKWYADQSVTLLHDAAVAIDRGAKVVITSSGSRLPYDHLILATGSRNRPLPVPGAELSGVSGVRVKGDADALSPHLHEGTRVIVVGAGFIGLEFASVAVARGAAVHVVEFADRPMRRGASEPTALAVLEAHKSWGVTFDFEHSLASINGEGGRVRSVTLDDGRERDADLVVYGIGVVPNTALAAESGLAVDNGILVDDRLLTADPNISAIGDAVNFPCAQRGGTGTRLESVQNAADQAKHIAAMLLGKAHTYTALPWFWSDQGNLKLQIAGLSADHDHVIALPAGEGERIVLCFAADRLVAVETINRPDVHMLARRVLAGSVVLTAAEAAVPGFTLSAWEEAQRAHDLPVR